MAKTTDTTADLSEDVVDVPRVQVFASGDYGKKGVYSDDDLQLIADSYSSDVHEAPITTDHDQRGPAFGWVKKVYREGSKLFADLANVPASFADAIKKRRWVKRSAEIYREFGETGKPYLAAVTFLGAARPHVKGMEEIALSESYFSDKGETIDIDWEEPAKFGELTLPMPPEGATHGVISQSSIAQPLADNHFHDVFLDEDGNGYTGPPTCYEYGDRCKQDEKADGYHVHIVTNYEIQAAGTPAHVHRLTTPFNEGEQEKTMSEPIVEPVVETEKTETPAPEPQKAEFSEAEAKLREENEKMRKQIEAIELERFAEKQEAAFEAAVSKKIEPALRNKMKAVFMGLPRDTEVIEFGEGEKSALRPALLKLFGEFPTREDLETVKGKPTSHNRATFSDDNNLALANRAREIAKEKNIDIAEAQIEAFNEANPS